MGAELATGLISVFTTVLNTMKPSDLQNLFDRVKRSRHAVYVRSDAGYTRDPVTEDVGGARLEVIGIKSPERLEDELLTMFIWIWSMKDYLKQLCPMQGVDPKKIEDIANSSRSLSIAADVANRAKHGSLSKGSRCGDYARLDLVTIAIPQAAVASISFDRPTVRIDVKLPEDAELTARISFDNGTPSVDAFLIADEAIDVWVKSAFPLVGVTQPLNG